MKTLMFFPSTLENSGIDDLRATAVHPYPGDMLARHNLPEYLAAQDAPHRPDCPRRAQRAPQEDCMPAAGSHARRAIRLLDNAWQEGAMSRRHYREIRWRMMMMGKS